MSTNKAAWLMEKGTPFKVAEAPMPTPEPHSMTIRVGGVAVNPVDGFIQDSGLMVEEYPVILGFDAAGEVTELGSEVTGFKVGDRVTGIAGKESGQVVSGAMQLYTTVHSALAAKIPDHVSYTDASVLPLAMCTACVALFEPYNLGLPFPKPAPNPKSAKKVVIIWGGASSVGTCGIYAAKAAGLEVASMAGAHNQDYLKSIGVDYPFDYRSETLVEDVVKTLKGKESAGVFAAVFGDEVYFKGAEIASQLGGKQMVATVLPEHMKFDKEDQLAGDVKMGYNWGTSLKDTEVGPAILRDWVPAALANGTLKCKPDAHVAGKGLEACQDAVDLIKKGASAKKFVVEIQ